MVDTYTQALKARKIEQGAYANSYATRFNEDMVDIFDAGISGTLEIDIGSATTYALEAMQNGTLSETHYRHLRFVGTPASAVTITVPTSVNTDKDYVVENQTGQALTFKYAATSGQVIADGQLRHLLADGVDIHPGKPEHRRTAAEIAAGVTPVDYSYAPELPQRFGGAPGGSDARIAIQSVLNAAAQSATATDRGRVTITAGIWWISLDGSNVGLDIPSNVEVVFEAGASVKLLAHNASTYQILKIYSRSNVRIVNPTIDGNKAQNSAVSGEHGHGIDIRSSDNVWIERPVIRNCWGDGIYIGPVSSGGTPTTNLHIVKPYIETCRRQGISISSANGCWINDVVINDILGTDPQSGIDIEPNVAADVIWDVYIDGAKIGGCTAGAGFLVQPGSAATDGFRVFAKNVQVENCLWGFQTRGAYQSGFDPGAVVQIEDFTARNIKSAGLYFRKHHSGSWPFRIIRPVIEDVNQDGLTSVDGAFICLFRTAGAEDAAPYNYPIGNIHIQDASLSGAGTNYFEISGRTNGVSNISFMDPVLMAGDTATIQTFMDHVIKLGSTQNYVMSNRRKSFTPSSTISTSAAAQGATNDSLEAILLWAAKFRYQWGYEGQLTIELQSGTTLTRQVLITDGPDLGWVKITAQGGATITVQRSAVTRSLTGLGTPVFGGRTCIMPEINASFSLDTSGSATSGRHMYALRDGARGVVLAATLTSNDGYGSWIDHGSQVTLRSSTLVGSLATDMNITNASIVHAGGATGTSNLTDNTPAAGGLILR